MNQYNEISTLQYMGSKARIIENICDPIIKNKSIDSVIDLFAGTGAIGYALKPYKNITSNDLEYYAFVINEAILNGCDFDKLNESAFFDAAAHFENVIETFVHNSIEIEQRFFNTDSDVDYKRYREFCELTPSVFQSDSVNAKFEDIQRLVDKITPGSKAKVEFPCLFLTYFSNTYFGIKQCCQIDALRGAISQIKSQQIQYVLLAVLMSVMSETASTTTHFAQYLRVKSKATCQNLISKRKTNIVERFKTVLAEYREKGVCERSQNVSTCYNLDFQKCLDKIQLNSRTLVYADPPYFKEHYSRYYHVLNTLCLYDYPALSINPQTHEYSIGRYRENRTVSDFGKKSKALGAFQKMIDKCAEKGSWLIISYSDNSIVNIKDLERIAKARYDVLIEHVELNHSKQGRSSMSKVEEYIFVCRPPQMVTSVDEKLAVIKELKPVVDNPAGLMHNYMARKPYNIVSEIIKRFSPENGCVLDPMFGSGTTIIEASKLGRRAIGTDINQLAYKLCRVSLRKWDLQKVNALIDCFCDEVREKCKHIYTFEEAGETRVLERCHFNQENGKLIPTEYWYKLLDGTKLSGRHKAIASDFFASEYNKIASEKTANVPDLPLIPNSRIAIGRSDTVYTYFCNRNRLALSSIKEVMTKHQNDYGYEIIELLVSSSINLIKLSDKKASSQMPYWLPKKGATSRNAIMIVEKKAKAFKDGLAYLNQVCENFITDDDSSFIQIENTPAQLVSRKKLPDQCVDLVLTDPPYTDQVPYLEYSQLWYKVMGWDGLSEDTLAEELVVSDAPSRLKDADDFNAIFEMIINRIYPALKDNGYFIIFYHTFDLKSWSNILNLMERHGLTYCGQIASATPRKSFKTVMTPKRTLDGNYIVVFQKNGVSERKAFSGNADDAKKLSLECAHKIVIRKKEVTSQDLYDSGMLKDAFEHGYLSVLAEKYTSFVDVISDEFVFENGLWKDKLCTGC